MAGDVSVAVVIPLYNGAPYIREALASVLAQTEPADEIIVVDDGSTDDGPQITRDMLSGRNNARVLSKPNGGQASARNLGIAHASSSHVALLDQDDVWYPDHIEALRRPFLTGGMRNLAYVYGSVDRIDESGRTLEHDTLARTPAPHPKAALEDCLRHDMFILPSASLISKDAFNAVGGFDERLVGYEDDDLFLRMFIAGYRSVYLKREVTSWRLHAASTSFGRRMCRSRMIYLEKLLAAFPDDPGLGIRWTTDMIIPRFRRALVQGFIHHLRLGDTEVALQSWGDIKSIAPYLRPSKRRRLALVSPLVRSLVARGHTRAPKYLARVALH